MGSQITLSSNRRSVLLIYLAGILASIALAVVWKLIRGDTGLLLPLGWVMGWTVRSLAGKTTVRDLGE